MHTYLHTHLHPLYLLGQKNIPAVPKTEKKKGAFFQYIDNLQKEKEVRIVGRNILQWFC